MAIHVLSDADVIAFRAMKAKLDRLVETNAIINPEERVNQASDIYLIEVPTGGIPPLTLVSGTADPDLTTPTTVSVVHLDEDEDEAPNFVVIDPDFTIDVHNVSLEKIEEYTKYAVAHKSKFGQWLVGDLTAASLIVQVPVSGIVGVTLASGTSDPDSSTSVTCDVFEFNSSDELVDTGDTVDVFNVGDDTLLFEDSTYWIVHLESRSQHYVFGEVIGSSGCDGIVDPDDCWIGCRTGTGSGMGTDDADNPDTLFHKQPFTATGEADCTLIHYIENVEACWSAFDDAGHFFGYLNFQTGWQSDWGFDQPAGP